MKRTGFFLILALTSLWACAQSPQGVISSIIRKHPMIERRVWYCYDESSGREYLRQQIWPQRHAVSAEDIEKLKASFLYVWSITDFNRDQGAQYLGPDTVSITIDGNRSAAFDLGKSALSADYAFSVAAKERGSKPDFSNLLKVFEKVKAGHKTTVKKVKYTGYKNCRFVFQRGKGSGWTQGTRTTVYGASFEDFRALRAAMRKFIGSKVPVTVFDYTWQVLVKSESTPYVYAIGYNQKTKQLNFLQATVEDEICIPYEWQKIDYKTNSETTYTH